MPERLDVIIDRNLANAPENRCFWWDGRWYDQAFFKKLTDSCEETLRTSGFSQGQRLAVLMQNSPIVPALALAVWRLGGSICPLNVKSGIASLFPTLTLLEPFTVIVSEEVRKEAGSVLDEHKIPHTVCPLMGPLPKIQGQSGKPESTDLAVIFSTSGTTGTPKAVPLSHGNILSNCEVCVKDVTDLQEGDVFLNVLPNFHAFGFTTGMVLPFILKGAQAIVPNFMPPKHTIEAIVGAPVNIVLLVPTMLSLILGTLERSGRQIEGVKLLIVGGDRYNSRQDGRVEAVFGKGALEGYGITECSPVLCVNRTYERRRLGTVGEFLDDFEWRLRNEDGTPAEGNEGVLWVSGPGVAKGYFRVEEVNRERFDGRWFNTGDFVRVEDGYVKVIDRVTDIIIVGGFNVYPQEVEAVLREHPAVQDVVVVGVPNATSGEIAKAFIQKKPESEVSELEIIRYSKERLAHYKVPRQVEFVDGFPTSSVGKVLRRILRDREREKNQEN